MVKEARTVLTVNAFMSPYQLLGLLKRSHDGRFGIFPPPLRSDLVRQQQAPQSK